MKLYKPKDIMELLCIDRQTLARYTKEGSVPEAATSTQKGHRRYTQDQYDEIKKTFNIVSYTIGTEVVWKDEPLSFQTVQVLLFAGFYRVEVENTELDTISILHRSANKRKAVKLAKIVSKHLSQGVWE